MPDEPGTSQEDKPEVLASVGALSLSSEPGQWEKT